MSFLLEFSGEIGGSIYGIGPWRDTLLLDSDPTDRNVLTSCNLSTADITSELNHFLSDSRRKYIRSAQLISNSGGDDSGEYIKRHNFIVLNVGFGQQDVDNYLSVEKFSDHILVQRGPLELLISVAHKVARGGVIKRHQIQYGKWKLSEFCTWVGQWDEFSRPYNLATSNCRHFTDGILQKLGSQGFQHQQ
jgi:hypothetical protein